MPPDVHILVFNLVGQPSIAPQPTAMRKVEAYLRQGRRYGLSDQELAQDVASRWPSDRRVVEVETLPSGDVWLTLAPAHGRAGRPTEPPRSAEPKAGR